MTSYFNEEKQEFDLEQWEVDSIKKDIYHKMLVKSKTSGQENRKLRKFFQYYDKYNCRHLDYENFMKALDRMGVVPEEYSHNKYKDYFSKMTNGKKYINYHDFIESLPTVVYPKMRKNKVIN